jgi:CRISPR/Cas system CSM-associated protein Csm2 small subunit
MKKSEIRKLIAEYKEINLKIKKVQNKKMLEKLKVIEHKYFHETGRDLKSDLKEIT